MCYQVQTTKLLQQNSIIHASVVLVFCLCHLDLAYSASNISIIADTNKCESFTNTRQMVAKTYRPKKIRSCDVSIMGCILQINH